MSALLSACRRAHPSQTLPSKLPSCPRYYFFFFKFCVGDMKFCEKFENQLLLRHIKFSEWAPTYFWLDFVLHVDNVFVFSSGFLQ